MSKILIWTDGSSLGNPGPGGWGAILRFGDKSKELSGGEKFTTNNRMELLAVIEALEALKTSKWPVEVYSDSKYVVDSIQKGWVFGWVKKPNFAGKKNEDLWLRFLKAYPNFTITFHWVKGHNGHPENERCDQLATTESLKFKNK
jgi:ribonuclease HI